MIADAYHRIAHTLGDRHRELNYKICMAIDLLKIGIVLDEMVAEGMEPEFVEIFKAQADGLLAAMRSENNRLKLIKTDKA